jgi:hypothetical protein
LAIKDSDNARTQPNTSVLAGLCAVLVNATHAGLANTHGAARAIAKTGGRLLTRSLLEIVSQ